MRLRQWSFALAFLVVFFPVPIAAQVEALHTAPPTGGMQSLVVAGYPARRVVVLDSTKLIANRTVFSPAAEQTFEAEMSRSKKYALIGAAVGAIAGGVVFHTTLADRWEPSGDGYVPPISWAYGAFALAGGALGALVGYAVAPQ